MTAPQRFRGEKLGLPESGRGSLAPGGARVGAFLIDAIASGIVAALFVRGSGNGFEGALPQLWSYVPFVLIYVLGVLFAGRTLGMYLLGLRMIRVDRDSAIGPGRIVARTALLCILVPAVVFDRDGRGMHDRLTDTAVVRN